MKQISSYIIEKLHLRKGIGDTIFDKIIGTVENYLTDVLHYKKGKDYMYELEDNKVIIDFIFELDKFVFNEIKKSLSERTMKTFNDYKITITSAYYNSKDKKIKIQIDE